MKLVIPIHSVIDVITNSSTEIFTNASKNAPKVFKELIDSILKIAGSDKTSDDLFEFTVKTFPTDVDETIGEAEEQWDCEFEGKPEWDSNKDWDENISILKKWFEQLPEAEAIVKEFCSTGGDYPTAQEILIIKSKDGSMTKDLTNLVMETLSQYEYYC